MTECPYCGFSNTVRNGSRFLNTGERIQKYICKSCRHSFCTDSVKPLLNGDEKRVIETYYKKLSSHKIAKRISKPASTVSRYLKRTHPEFIPETNYDDYSHFNLNLEDELGEFIGVFAGDGNEFHSDNGAYRITLFPSIYESGYANYLSRTLQKLLNKKPNIWINKKTNVINVTIFGKNICNLIHNYLYFKEHEKARTIRLKSSLEKYNDKFKIGFVRGLVSSDGTVTYKSKKRIEFDSTSKILAKQYADILNYLGIRCKIYKRNMHDKNIRYSDLYTAVTQDTESMYKFYKRIGFNEPLRLRKLESVLGGFLQIN